MSQNKKIKRKSMLWAAIVPSLVLIGAGGAAAGLALTGFLKENTRFTINVAGETTNEFDVDNSKNFLSLNHESVIYYKIKSPSKTIKSFVLKVGDKQLFKDDDYLLEDGRIIIFAQCMTSKDISINVTLEEQQSFELKSISATHSGNFNTKVKFQANRLSVVATIVQNGEKFTKTIQWSPNENEGYQIYQYDSATKTIGDIVPDFSTNGYYFNDKEMKIGSKDFYIKYKIDDKNEKSCIHTVYLSDSLEFSEIKVISAKEKNFTEGEYIYPTNFQVLATYVSSTQTFQKELTFAAGPSVVKTENVYQIYRATYDEEKGWQKDGDPISEKIQVNSEDRSNGAVNLIIEFGWANAPVYVRLKVDNTPVRKLTEINITKKPESYPAEKTLKASDFEITATYSLDGSSEDKQVIPYSQTSSGFGTYKAYYMNGSDYVEIKDFDTVGIKFTQDTFQFLRFEYTFKGITEMRDLNITIDKEKVVTVSLTFEGKEYTTESHKRFETNYHHRVTKDNLKLIRTTTQGSTELEKKEISYGKIDGFRIYNSNESWDVLDEVTDFANTGITFPVWSSMKQNYYVLIYSYNGIKYQLPVNFCETNPKDNTKLTASYPTASTVGTKITSSNFTVKRYYKDGGVETGVNSTYGSEDNQYRVYELDLGEKKEITNFDTTGYTFTEADAAAGSKDFVIVCSQYQDLYKPITTELKITITVA